MTTMSTSLKLRWYRAQMNPSKTATGLNLNRTTLILVGWSRIAQKIVQSILAKFLHQFCSMSGWTCGLWWLLALISPRSNRLMDTCLNSMFWDVVKSRVKNTVMTSNQSCNTIATPLMVIPACRLYDAKWEHRSHSSWTSDIQWRQWHKLSFFYQYSLLLNYTIRTDLCSSSDDSDYNCNATEY